MYTKILILGSATSQKRIESTQFTSVSVSQRVFQRLILMDFEKRVAN